MRLNQALVGSCVLCHNGASKAVGDPYLVLEFHLKIVHFLFLRLGKTSNFLIFFCRKKLLASILVVLVHQ